MKQLLKRVMLLTLILIIGVSGTAFAASKKKTNNAIKNAKKVMLTGGKWEKEGTQKSYRLADGSLVKNKWVTIDGKIYYFSKKGFAKSGWFTWKKKTYYANEQSEVVYKQMQPVGKKTYYLNADGTKAVNEWVKIQGKYYRFNKKGVMQKNKLLTVNGKTYYVDKDGVRAAKQWIKIKSVKYYFSKKGELKKTKYLKGAPTYLYVGDSRTVGMSMAVQEKKTHFIGKVGMGYHWLTSTADGKVKAFIKNHKNVYVIYCFGVNDLGNIHQYIAYYRKMKAAYPKVAFRFLSVNPVVDGKSNASNAGIRSFNAKLKAAFSGEYIDTFDYLKGRMQTVDGLHYSAGTYRLLHNHVMTKIL